MKILKYIIIVVAVLSIGACKKFLTVQPTGFISPTANLSSIKVARALANGCYAKLQGLLNGQPSSYGGNVWNLMEFMTGKSNSDLGQTGYVNFQTLIYSNTSFYFDTWWQQMYLGVGATNLAIQKIPTINAAGLSATDKTNM